MRKSNLFIDVIGFGKLYQVDKVCGSCCESSANGTCSTANCVHEDMKITSDDMVQIVSFDLVEQLRLLIGKNMDLLREYQEQARVRNTPDSNDIVRGDVYQAILSNNRDFFVSVMFHNDGVPLYKSKNCNAWPILGAVLELPPFSRTRADNMLLLSIWIGKKKPNFDVVFKRLSSQLSHVKTNGIQIKSSEHIKIIFPMLMGDMPALSTMVQFVEPHAFYACMFCSTKGTYNHQGHCIIYDIDNNAELRTRESFEKCAKMAASMQSRISRDRTIGVKGLSTFSEILDVPLPHSVVIDAMHTVFLCHAKKLLVQLQTFIAKENVPKINLKLRSMNFIHDILRRPRSFSNVQKWKASEIRTFILYIGLPVLAEFIPEEISGDLALYCIIIRLLHDYWDNNKILSNSISSLLKMYMGSLSQKVKSNVYPPNLLTISTHTYLHLPLQCKKFGRLDWLTNFVFESFLGYLKAFIKGSSGAGQQLAFAFISNFLLSKLHDDDHRAWGHFSIDKETFGSNIIKISHDEPIRKFLLENGFVHSNTIFFSRLHYGNVTYHSFLYSRKGSTCSYLVSYEHHGVISYGYALCLFSTNNECSVVVQKLTRVNQSLTACFSSHKYVTAIKDFVDKVYVVTKRVQPSLLTFDSIDVCSVNSLRSRCFSVPLGDDFMVVTSYSCAFEHN